ncbi:MAG: class I SAM-dependent methyltransferase [Coriobacteriales bacterium]|nr:class I SAM-dependent methyltransferase [Coriobacteriales bacterium]
MRRPRGWGGRLMLWSMDTVHGALAQWGLGFLMIRPNNRILDIGCGSGKTIARMLVAAPQGCVCGLDPAPLSVGKSIERNLTAVHHGRCEIKQGDVSKIPWPDSSFDLITAFETIYFWPDLTTDLLEIRRALKPGGTVMICNGMMRAEDSASPVPRFERMLDMRIYSVHELRLALGASGFFDPHVVTKGGWLCITAMA